MNEKISTGIEGLDKLVHGGFYKGSSTLVAGAPGIGKTTLGLQFIVGGIKNNEPGIVVTFEEFPETLYRDALALGWDLRSFEEKGLLKIIFTSPLLFKKELEEEAGVIDKSVAELGAERILIDPANYFEGLSDDPKGLRRVYNSLVNGLKRAFLTSVLTCEIPQLFGTLEDVGEALPFIVENILVMKYVELESEMKRVIFVVKSRGSDHDKDIREFEITNRGIEVKEPLKEYEGILSSTPTRLSREKIIREIFE